MSPNFLAAQLAPHCPPLEGSHLVVNSSVSEHGSIVAVSCDPGYQIQGPHVLECLDTGAWSGAVPTCAYGKLCKPAAARLIMCTARLINQQTGYRAVECDVMTLRTDDNAAAIFASRASCRGVRNGLYRILTSTATVLPI